MTFYENISKKIVAELNVDQKMIIDYITTRWCNPLEEGSTEKGVRGYDSGYYKFRGGQGGWRARSARTGARGPPSIYIFSNKLTSVVLYLFNPFIVSLTSLFSFMLQTMEKILRGAVLSLLILCVAQVNGVPSKYLIYFATTLLTIKSPHLHYLVLASGSTLWQATTYLAIYMYKSALPSMLMY